MKIIKPSVTLIKEKDPYKKIELVGRVCYKSENKITKDSASKFVSTLINREHLSVLEHAIFHCKIVSDNNIVNTDQIKKYFGKLNSRFVNITFDPIDDKPRAILSTNYRVLLNCRQLKLLRFEDNKFTFNTNCFNVINSHCTAEIIDFDNIETTEYEKYYHKYLTMRFICDRGVSHEIVRHRLFSFMQESTRYVKYNNKNMEFIEPSNYNEWDKFSKNYFLDNCITAETNYCKMLDNGRTPQEARAVLPNALKTELIVTGNIMQWEHFFNLRCSKTAHPDMQIVANKAKELYEKEMNIVD